MKLLGVGAAVALAIGAVASGAASASASPVGPSAAFAGHLVAGPGAVTVGVTYTCTTDITPANHLFVAVKQGPEVNNTTHTSSDWADTFYSTNWKSDAGPNLLQCDGVQHTQTVVLKPQPGFVPSVPRLHSGPALVQICVFDNITGVDSNGDPVGGFAPSYTMEQVHAGNGQSR
jgi:hypothetical protein